MDNPTHTLVGLILAKAGLERLSPYAPTVCMVAANAPDIDVLTRLGGAWFAVEHHRGITHSLIGVFVLSLLLPLAFFYIEKFVARRRHVRSRIRLRGLMLASLISCATHPLLDWLNSYGVRPFLPWDGHWYYGDILYIFDPWLWLMLGATAFLLTADARWRVWMWAGLASVLTALILLLPQGAGLTLPYPARIVWLVGIGLVIWARHTRLSEQFGARLAQAALLSVALYCTALAFVHAQAQATASVTATALAQQHGETVLRIAAMPTFANPTNWLCVAETERATYRFEMHVPTNVTATEADAARIEKPQGAAGAQVQRAEQDARAQIFLRFARFPIVQLQPDGDDTLVQFADLRFTTPGRARGRGGSFTLAVRVPRVTP